MDEDDILAEFMPSKKGRIALTTLQYHVHGNDLDEADLGPETLKLRNHYRKKNVSHFSMTLSPAFNGSSEDLAKVLNEQDEYMADPIRELISRIDGLLMLKRDYVRCTENRKRVTSQPPYFDTVLPTIKEKHIIRRYKEDIDLFERAVMVIKDLKGQLDGK